MPRTQRRLAGIRCEFVGRWGIRSLEDATLIDCHLPGGRLGNALLPLRSRLRRVQLDRCDLEESLLERVDLEDCVFIETRLSGALKTVATKCTLVRCRFEGGRGATIQQSTLRDVTIAGVDRGFHFEDCHVSGLTVAGTFRGKFVDCELVDCDFSTARFKAASGFISSKLSRVRLPSGDSGFLVRSTDLAAGMGHAIASGRLRAETAERLGAIGEGWTDPNLLLPVEDDWFEEDLTAPERAAILDAFLPFRVDRVGGPGVQ